MTKIYLLILVFPFFCFSQNSKERQEIISTYNSKAISDLKLKSKQFDDLQNELIKQYKLKNNVVESESHSLQRIYNGTPMFFSTSNAGSSKTINANSMYPGGSLGLNVTGYGMYAGIWDGGKVRYTHQEFTNSRVNLSDAASKLSDHSTHVTGTILAAGTSPTRKGLAYEAQAKTYDWTSDYNEMVTFGANGYLVSNHSYGYDTTNLPVWNFGNYDQTTAQIDDVENTCPYYQVVIAAGNDRGSSISQFSNKGGYDLLSGMATSKNGITVAAVEEVLNYVDNSSVIMSSFSNYGPTDDGRIKPDISAKGVNVSSCISTNDTAYSSYNGTSMATPAVTGLIVLLQKHFNNVSGAYMKAATVRGLLCHSAREAGSYEGPDYEFGWGLADGLAAANIISNKGVTSVIEENTLNQSQTFTKKITLTTPQKLEATICWTDPTSSIDSNGVEDKRTSKLVNNLDLKIIKDNVIYYPWKMDYTDPTLGATRATDNNIDNIEKVQIDLAQPGTYTIQVTHKGTLESGSQDYSLITSSANGLSLNSADFISDNTFFVFPNPASDVLNFTNTKNISLSNISINDITGKVVYESNGTVPDNSIAISNLQQGVYFVKFTSNSKSYVKKFVKQ